MPPLHRLKCAALALLLVALSMTGVDGLSPRRAAAAPPTGTTILELFTLNAFNRMVHETGGPYKASNKRFGGQHGTLPVLPQRAIKDADTLTGPFSIWFRTSSDGSLNDGGLAASDFTVTNGSISSITKHALHERYTNPSNVSAVPYWTADITPDAGATSVTIRLNTDTSSHSFAIDSSAPKVRWAGFSSFRSYQNGFSISEGEVMDLSVQFSEKVTVVGSPTVTVVAKADGTTRQAVYQSGSGTSELIFRYTVEAGLFDPDDKSSFAPQYTSTSIVLPTGASIRDDSSNDATLTLPPRVVLTYNWLRLPTSKPTTSDSVPPVRDGAVFERYVRFSEPVVVTGNPQTVWIFRTAGSPSVSKPVLLDYVSGSGTDTLLFRYTLTSAAGLDPSWQDASSGLWFYGGSTIRSKANGLDAHYSLDEQIHQIFAVTEDRTHYLGQSLHCCLSWPPSPADSYVEVQISTPSSQITITDDTMRWHPRCPSGDPDCVEVPFTTTHYATLKVGADPDSEDTWTTVQYDWTQGTDTQYKNWWGTYTQLLVVLEPRTAPPVFGGDIAPVRPVRSVVDFELDTGRGIRSLHDENAAASGVWSDGESLWVLDAAAGRVFVYALADGQRRARLEFELDAANASPVGLSSDGETVWVLDSAAGRLFAYSLANGERLPERDVALEGRFGSPRAVWSGGGSHYVVSNPLAVYDAATGALVGSWELDRLNRSPAGMWSDGVTLWISNSRPSKLFAYRLPLFDGAEPGGSEPGDVGRLVRVRDEEFNLLPVVNNSSPAGLWSDGATMYVADSDDGRVYAYKMPDSIDARLASLSLTGVDIGEFSPAVANYSGVVEAGVRRTIVKARAAQPGAKVAIAPGDSRHWGHQVRVFNGAEVTVTVTSPDGSRSRVYRVQISAPPQGHFTDDDASVHADAIDAAATAGIVAGCNPPEADLFCPGRPVTRAEMATFLVRALELAPTQQPAGFVDIDPQGVHADAIDAAAAAGIVAGCNPPEADLFCPGRPVTRAEMATFLVRAFELAPAGRPARFVDVDRQSVHAADIDALYAAGITKGCFARPRRYCGDRPVTRAEMAAFLARALDLPAP